MAGLSTTCTAVEGLLSAYLDGELRGNEPAVVAHHLESCPECVGVLEAVREARAAVRALPMLDVPALVAPAVHAGDGLSAYLDGELDAAAADSVAAHLAGCSVCREELQQLDGARTAVRALPRLDAPAALVTDRTGAARHGRLRRRAALVVAGAAAAAVVAFAVSGPEHVAPLDLDSLATQHSARISVESGFSVIPATFPTGGGP